MKQHILSRLLWLANGRPPSIGRERFYAVKKRLLERYATRTGVDLQEITKTCFRCEGDDDPQCRRCGGTGIYDQYWFELHRWQWGRHCFHSPGVRRYTKPDGEVQIRGRIEHKERPGRWPEEAALWLALMYDRRLWWMLVTACWHTGWTWLPMLNLRWLLTTIKHESVRIRGGRCRQCNRWFTRVFDNHRAFSTSCRRCRKPKISLEDNNDSGDYTDEDLPF